jgi:hypothetical protein
MDVYCLMTNEVDMQHQDEIEGEKYDNFWDLVENRLLNAHHLTFENVERVFNHSPVSYQRHYIELLNYENNIGNNDSDHEDTQSNTSIDTPETSEYVEGHLTDNYDTEPGSDEETEVEPEIDVDSDYDSMPGLISCSDDSDDDDDDDCMDEEALDIISNITTINSSL